MVKVIGESEGVRAVDLVEFNPAVESIISSALLVDLFFQLSVSFSSRKG